MTANASESKNTVALVVKIVIAVGVSLWVLKTCDQQKKDSVYELQGQGRLQANGLNPELLPPGAGFRWAAVMDGEGPEERRMIRSYFKSYQSVSRQLLGELTYKQYRKIPEREIGEAANNPSRRRQIVEKLIKRYD